MPGRSMATGPPAVGDDTGHELDGEANSFAGPSNSEAVHTGMHDAGAPQAHFLASLRARGTTWVPSGGGPRPTCSCGSRRPGSCRRTGRCRPSGCPPTMHNGSRGAAGSTCRRPDVSGRECKSAPVARTVRVNRYCNEINDGKKRGQKAPDLRYESVPKKSFRRDIRSIRNGCVHVRFGISALRHTLSIGRTGTTEMSGAG